MEHPKRGGDVGVDGWNEWIYGQAGGKEGTHELVLEEAPWSYEGDQPDGEKSLITHTRPDQTRATRGREGRGDGVKGGLRPFRVGVREQDGRGY